MLVGIPLTWRYLTFRRKGKQRKFILLKKFKDVLICYFYFYILIFINYISLILINFLSVTGNGDATYNPRRSVLGALCEGLKIAYNLFKIDVYSSEVAKLCRKAKWNCNESSYYGND